MAVLECGPFACEFVVEGTLFCAQCVALLLDCDVTTNSHVRITVVQSAGHLPLDEPHGVWVRSSAAACDFDVTTYRQAFDRLLPNSISVAGNA